MHVRHDLHESNNLFSALSSYHLKKINMFTASLIALRIYSVSLKSRSVFQPPQTPACRSYSRPDEINTLALAKRVDDVSLHSYLSTSVTLFNEFVY